MKKLKKFYDQRQLHWMVLPGVAFMIVFNYIPIYGIIIAFKNYTIVDTVSSAPWVGLENFRIIMEDSFFWEAVRNTLAISLMKLFLGFAIPIILAVMIFEMRDGHLKKVIQTISYIPHFFSWIVLGGMLISWLSTNGFINQVMMSLGLMNQGVNHLLNLILNVSGLLGSNLDQTLVLMNAQNQNKSEVINSFVYRMGLTQGDFSYATAVGLGISVISIVLLVITDRITRKMNNGRSVIL